MATYTISTEVAPTTDVGESSGAVRLRFTRQVEVAPTDKYAESSGVPVLTPDQLLPTGDYTVSAEVADLGEIVVAYWESDIVNQFILAAVTTSRTTLYTVPVGRNAVIRWMDLVNTTGSAITVDVWLGGVLWENDRSVPANDKYARDTIAVLGPGAFIEMQASGAGVNAFVAGVLELTS